MSHTHAIREADVGIPRRLNPLPPGLLATAMSHRSLDDLYRYRELVNTKRSAKELDLFCTYTEKSNRIEHMRQVGLDPVIYHPIEPPHDRFLCELDETLQSFASLVRFPSVKTVTDLFEARLSRVTLYGDLNVRVREWTQGVVADIEVIMVQAELGIVRLGLQPGMQVNVPVPAVAPVAAIPVVVPAPSVSSSPSAPPASAPPPPAPAISSNPPPIFGVGNPAFTSRNSPGQTSPPTAPKPLSIDEKVNVQLNNATGDGQLGRDWASRLQLFEHKLEFPGILGGQEDVDTLATARMAYLQHQIQPATTEIGEFFQTWWRKIPQLERLLQNHHYSETNGRISDQETMNSVAKYHSDCCYLLLAFTHYWFRHPHLDCFGAFYQSANVLQHRPIDTGDYGIERLMTIADANERKLRTEFTRIKDWARNLLEVLTDLENRHRKTWQTTVPMQAIDRCKQSTIELTMKIQDLLGVSESVDPTKPDTLVMVEWDLVPDLVSRVLDWMTYIGILLRYASIDAEFFTSQEALDSREFVMDLVYRYLTNQKARFRSNSMPVSLLMDNLVKQGRAVARGFMAAIDFNTWPMLHGANLEYWKSLSDDIPLERIVEADRRWRIESKTKQRLQPKMNPVYVELLSTTPVESKVNLKADERESKGEEEEKKKQLGVSASAPIVNPVEFKKVERAIHAVREEAKQEEKKEIRREEKKAEREIKQMSEELMELKLREDEMREEKYGDGIVEAWDPVEEEELKSMHVVEPEEEDTKEPAAQKKRKRRIERTEKPLEGMDAITEEPSKLLVAYQPPTYYNELQKRLIEQHERKKQEAAALEQVAIPVDNPQSQQSEDIKLSAAKKFKNALEATLKAGMDQNKDRKKRAEMTVAQTNAAIHSEAYPKKARPILSTREREKERKGNKKIKQLHVHFKSLAG